MMNGDAGALISECVNSHINRWPYADHILRRCGFYNADTFRAFCALGDIDPDSVRSWYPYPQLPEEFRSRYQDDRQWIWISRTKDIVIETRVNPLNDGYCHYFGLTGAADKAIMMWDFMYDKNRGDRGSEEGEMATVWDEMSWDRGYC
jgi:hypothetical protein